MCGADDNGFVERKTTTMSEIEPPYELIADELLGGTVVPFFGSAASAAYRPPDATEWENKFLPSGPELAAILARASNYSAATAAYDAALSDLAEAAAGAAPSVPVAEIMAALKPVLVRHVGGPPGLALIASWYAHVQSTRPALERKLRQAFDVTSEPGPLHTRLADIPEINLYVTTNYDDLLERALGDVGLDYDIVWYEAKERSADRRKFVHKAPGAEPVVIQSGNDYKTLTMTLERPVVLKLHGCVDREPKQGEVKDSYVITEDNYIGYLTGSDVRSQLPIALVNRMIDSSFLFLGYSLADWNMRVILNRIWGSSVLDKKSWAIQREPSDPNVSKIERTLWNRRENMDVELIYCELSEYARQLEARLPAPAAAVKPGP